MAGGKKEGKHGIRPVKGKHKKVHLRAECEKCGRFECVSVYEDHVEHADFKVSFFECPECRKTFCDICVSGEDDSKIECPFCHRLKAEKVKPFDIYVCGVCFEHWWREGGFCHECRYD